MKRVIPNRLLAMELWRCQDGQLGERMKGESDGMLGKVRKKTHCRMLELKGSHTAESLVREAWLDPAFQVLSGFSMDPSRNWDNLEEAA